MDIDSVYDAKWAADGELIVIDAVDGGVNKMMKINGGPRADVFDFSTEPATVTPNGPDANQVSQVIFQTGLGSHDITSIAPAVDLADPSVIYTIGDEVYKATLEDSTTSLIHTGNAPRVSQWTRNLTAFPFNGTSTDLPPRSIAANDVPLQKRNPASPPPDPAQIQNSGLLKLSLLNAGLLKIGLAEVRAVEAGLAEITALEAGPAAIRRHR